MRFLNKLEVDYYTHIDILPIYLWNKINETQDLTFLLKKRKKAGAITSIHLNILWRILLDQFIKQFGFSEDFLRIIRKQKEQALLRVQKVSNLDNSVQTFIDICDEELKEMQLKENDGNFFELKAYIEKGMGIHINAMQVSVSEFYSYIKILEKQNKSAAG